MSSAELQVHESQCCETRQYEGTPARTLLQRPPPWRQLTHTAAGQSVTRETAARLRRAQLVVWVLARGGRMAPTVE